ncbi:MAG: hypothetical protein ACTHMS_08885 [Jatrophihabitans sp.]|uniref:hypothetical protein n=1 Tax=Jatrophihabitans sp. TaxID=1932789 RepID=UPI003F81C15D
MTDGAVLPATRPEVGRLPLVELATAVVAIGGLALAARQGSVPLLVAVAVVQALLVASWFVGLAGVGRRGAAVLAVLAAGAADACLTHWTHDRLGPLLPVLGLAVPVLFVHQLARGAARVQLIRSLSSAALLVLTVVALSAVLQLRHEFRPTDLGAHVATAVLAAAAGAVVAGHLVDLLLATPRFDADVPRGLPGLVVAAAVGAVIGHVVLRHEHAFLGGRAAFVGGACGIVAALLAVAGSFALAEGAPRAGAWVERCGAVFATLLAPALLAPGAYLLCLVLRT